jgi:hypothetical protein
VQGLQCDFYGHWMCVTSPPLSLLRDRHANEWRDCMWATSDRASDNGQKHARSGSQRELFCTAQVFYWTIHSSAPQIIKYDAAITTAIQRRFTKSRALIQSSAYSLRRIAQYETQRNTFVDTLWLDQGFSTRVPWDVARGSASDRDWKKINIVFWTCWPK